MIMQEDNLKKSEEHRALNIQHRMTKLYLKLQDRMNRLNYTLRDSPTPEVLFKKIALSVNPL